METQELLHQGIVAARAGRKPEARELLMKVVDLDPRNEIAWSWLSGIMEDLEDRIVACENVLTINPNNEKARAYLTMLLQKRGEQNKADVENKPPTLETEPTKVQAPVQEMSKKQSNQKEIETPIQGIANKPLSLALAEQLEDEGKIEDAISTYELLAKQTKDKTTFDHIYKQIGRLEGLKTEKIQHVAPATSLLRMSFTWTLVYVGFMLIQIGLHPIANFSLLWLGLPFVGLGNFLLALSEVRIEHVIWQKVFLEDGTGSGFARVVIAVTGWVLIVLPFGLLLFNSLARLRDFQIPPEPF